MEDLISLDVDQSGVYNTRGRMEMVNGETLPALGCPFQQIVRTC